MVEAMVERAPHRATTGGSSGLLKRPVLEWGAVSLATFTTSDGSRRKGGLDYTALYSMSATAASVGRSGY
jgi:hypothetical protein